MRVIDAKKVKELLTSLAIVPNVIIEKWLNENTVRAIPIEFIEKKCRELYEHLYLDESIGVQMLLRDWEKENE